MKRFLLGVSILSSVVGVGSLGAYYGHEMLAEVAPAPIVAQPAPPRDLTPSPIHLADAPQTSTGSANPFGAPSAVERAVPVERAVAIERSDAPDNALDRYGRPLPGARSEVNSAAAEQDVAVDSRSNDVSRADRYADEPAETAARYPEQTAAAEEIQIDPADGDIPDARTVSATEEQAEPRALTPVNDRKPLDRYGRPMVDKAANAEPQTPAGGALADNSSRRAATPAANDDFSTPGAVGGGGEAGSGAGEEGTGRPGDPRLSGSQAPTLTIEKTAPAEIQIGKAAKFTIKVRNAGSVPAHGVEIHDVIPQGTQLTNTTPQATRSAGGELVWELGSLKPGDEQTVALELMPTAEGEVGSVATVHFRAEAAARTVATRPLLTMEASAPEKVMKGEEITLKIKISNPGTGAATGVVLSETIPEGLTHPGGGELEFDVGTLKPGESRELQLGLMAAAAGTVTNVLSARGDANLQAEARTELEVIAPQLEVSMTGPKRRYLERNATHNISISNPGTAPAKDVELVAVLPKELKFVEANNGGQFDPATHAVYWSLEELPPQETGTVVLTTLPLQPGEARLLIKTKANQNLADQREEVVSIEGLAAINFQLSDASDPIEVNAQTTYDVRVTNQGSKAAANVRLVALVPNEMKPISAEGPVRYRIEGQRFVFEPLKQLAPKADTSFKMTVQALQPGDLRLQVQISTDEIRDPITKEESTRVYGDE